MTGVQVGGSKILVTSIDGEVYAVSNKCSHLGLPLVGKTAMFQAEVRRRMTRTSEGTQWPVL